jgi:TRAP-type C4-dicarboxylate transport system permease small subunit
VKERTFRLALRLTRMTESIAALLLVAVVLMNLAQVFFRYVLVQPLSWSEESMRYTTTWMVLLAGSAALFRGEHMAINLFENVRSHGLRRAIELAVLVSIAVFSALLMWKGYPAAIENMRQVSPAMRVPMTLPYLAIPIGATLMLIKTVALMFLPEGALLDEEAEENRP